MHFFRKVFAPGIELKTSPKGITKLGARTKSKAKASDTLPKKRGNQGDFHGEREEFLTSQLDKYRNRMYWLRFSWRLLSQEPPEDEDNVPVDGVLTEEKKTAKAKVPTKTEAKIKHWFSYLRAPGGGASNPYAKFLCQLCSDERQPKHLPNWQVYMQDKEKNDAVNTKFAEDFPSLIGARNTIKERGQITHELLGLETAGVREIFRKRAEEEFEESIEYFKSKGDTGFEDPKLNEEERQDVQNRLGTTVQLLLDALCTYTGYHLTLFVGTVEDGWFDIQSCVLSWRRRV
ncbi:hypothetical protein DFH06DRAFT_1122837 [Mycena polygramma]|nr:hypothetical protein DFH06DRAFT_1122837 [Mycena polygramma]